MTKYTQISSLASAYSERFIAHRDQCTQVAHLIMTHLAEYFEAPSNMLQFVEIDAELKANHKQIDAPMLKQGQDGYWYFGLRVHFSDPKQRGYSDSVLKFGVKIDGENCSVKLDSTFAIDLTDTKTLNPLFDDIFKGYETYYSGKPSVIPQGIGFIQKALP